MRKERIYLKKRFIFIIVILIICLSITGCGSFRESKNEQKTEFNFSLTVDEFTDSFTEEIKMIGTLVSITVVDDKDTLSKIHTFVIKPSSELFESTHMQLTENSAGYIKDVIMFSDFGEFLKSDGSREKISNLDFCLFIYATAKTLDNTIDINALEKEFMFTSTQPESKLATLNNLRILTVATDDTFNVVFMPAESK